MTDANDYILLEVKSNQECAKVAVVKEQVTLSAHRGKPGTGEGPCGGTNPPDGPSWKLSDVE